MNAEQATQKSIHISAEKLLALVQATLGGDTGRPDDENPLPPGPWDPVIRAALEQVALLSPRPEPWRRGGSVYEPQPVPWLEALAGALAFGAEVSLNPQPLPPGGERGGRAAFGSKVEINPQPLPPRVAFLATVAQLVAGRAEVIQEVAGALGHDGGAGVGGYLSKFADEFCGNGFRLHYPWPGPRPHWYEAELNGADLIVLAAAFDRAAKGAYGAALRRDLGATSAKLLETGAARL